MCSQPVELAGICTAAACGTARVVARIGCRKYGHRLYGAFINTNAFAVAGRPVGLQDGCGLHTRPIAVHQQGGQLSGYDLDQTETTQRAPKFRQ